MNRHLSPPKRAPFSLRGVTPPHQLRCDANERRDPNALPLSLAVARPTHLAPHGSARSPSHGHRWPCWCALTTPFQPSPVPRSGHRRVCLLLSTCVNRRLPGGRPCLLFHRVTCPLARSKSREVPLACASDGYVSAWLLRCGPLVFGRRITHDHSEMGRACQIAPAP